MSTTNAVAVRELTADELNTAVTFDEAVAASGLTEADMTFVASPYTVLNKDKDILLDNPLFIRAVRFAVDAETENEYCVFYAVTRANELYVVTDGSTGIYAQLRREVEKRASEKHPTPFQNFMVANGLRKSDYALGLDNKPLSKADIAAGVKASSKGTTYYIG